MHMLQKPVSANMYSIGDAKPFLPEPDIAHVATYDISDADAMVCPYRMHSMRFLFDLFIVAVSLDLQKAQACKSNAL